MRRHVLIIGEAPGMRTDPLLPLACGRSGKRLRELAGSLLDRAELVNLLNECPGNSAGLKGCKFPLHKAIRAAVQLLAFRKPEPTAIVALGWRVWQALGLVADCPYFTQRTVQVGMSGRRRVFVKAFPHPSGISHFWNEKENCEVAAWHLRESLS